MFFSYDSLKLFFRVTSAILNDIKYVFSSESFDNWYDIGTIYYIFHSCKNHDRNYIFPLE